ncbi:MAG: ATP-binding protein, partial [Anaerolineales bacterium]|nr:ATP-binding protein [Anaerolineales bacterium]
LESIYKSIHLRQTITEHHESSNEDGSVKRLLINPLFIENHPIGIILLTRSLNTPPFLQEDQELITTLGNQVSIAVANALKYAQTDQALQSRLNELATLQQIDRELNASLEIERTLSITLHHALQQSNADAGVIGLIKENYFHPIHSIGYQNPFSSFFPLEELPITLASLDLALVEDRIFLEYGQKSVAIPLTREDRIIALLILESRNKDFCPTDMQSFLSRLCSHAAMALSNAILYSEVQQANSAKSEFVSLVSHELKTPMTAIKGYADLIAQGAVGPINEVQANFLSTIRANVNRMTNLVSDLADVSRIEAGKLHLEYEATSVHEVLQEVIRTVSTQLEEKKQKIQLDLPSDLPEVWCDRNRLIQIYNNLVSNAIKYSPPETLIEIKCLQINDPRDGKTHQRVVLSSVHDQGVGISAEDQPKIFQKFFRSEDPKVRENPGTGLGLNITKYLVELQGGQIWFESQLGIGTTFYFTIPVVSVE